jgi:LysR substrate binding domain-containing protein/mycothiol maleylpyruvate isomerase-like protein
VARDPQRPARLLLAEHEALPPILRRAAEPAFDRPSACPGWSVRDVLAHCGAALSRVATGRLVVGMSTSPGRGGLLPAIRSRFTAVRPEASVELRQVAMHGAHPLAGLEVIDFAELLDEPFLALPESAGPLRDYWLALDAREGQPPRIGAEISSTDETYEALLDGRGICLVAAGNAPLIALEGVITRPVRGISPSVLALAWRTEDRRPLILDYARACTGPADTPG